MRCSWCGLNLNTPVGVEPPRCIRCRKPLCDPILRDCGLEHWTHTHSPRRVVEVKGP
jgi:hypothetical protein